MPVPTEPPVAFAPLVRLDRSRLLGLLGGLGAEDWGRPTPCPDWAVRDVVAHIVGDDVGLISSLRDGHRGTPAPAGLDEDGFIDWLDDLQREWVHAARRMSPQLMVELVRSFAEPLVHAIAEQDPQASTASVSWADDGLVPAWLDHGRELTERWIHRQQLLEALGRPSDLRVDLAGPVLDTLRWAYPYRLGGVDRPEGASVLIEVDGAGLTRWWGLVRGAVGWTFTDAVDDPTLTVRMTTEQAWRLLTNNHRDADHGPIHVDGDRDLAACLLRTRAIIGHPH